MLVSGGPYQALISPPEIQPIYVVDIFRDIVASFAPMLLPIIQANETTALGQSLINTIDYQYGHVKELVATLFQYDKSQQLKYTKYPLVYLVMDFPEDRGNQPGFYATVTLEIVIAHQTDATYKASERMQNVFKPVLYPIYYSLLDAIAAHPMINENNADIIKHRKIDRVYWGRESIGGTDGNVLNDYVDAIDITNLKLTILDNNC